MSNEFNSKQQSSCNTQGKSPCIYTYIVIYEKHQNVIKLRIPHKGMKTLFVRSFQKSTNHNG